MADALIVRRGGGAASLIKVIGVSAAGSLPATAQAQTIAVITTAAIGITTVATVQPASPAVGDVWIDVSRGSQYPIKATKRPETWIYPVHLRQYTAGGWVDRDAYTYTGSAWVEWYQWAYIEGDARTAFGGTWVMDYTGLGSVTLAATRLVLAGGNGAWSCRKQTVVDLTNYRYLRCRVTRTAGGAAGYFFLEVNTVSGSSAYPPAGPYTGGQYTAYAIGTEVELTLDVTALNSSYYIILYGGTNNTFEISRVWLEY